MHAVMRMLISALFFFLLSGVNIIAQGDEKMDEVQNKEIVADQSTDSTSQVKDVTESAEKAQLEEGAAEQKDKQSGETASEASVSEDNVKAESEVKDESSQEETTVESSESQENNAGSAEQKVEPSDVQAEQKESVVEEPQEEIKPIDTIDIAGPSGNWLFKRIWWQNAEARYEKIRMIFEQLAGLPMVFFEKRSDLERSLFDPFYREIGFDQGELFEIVDYLIELVDKERANEGMLDMHEREFLNTLMTEKKSLEQLKMDVDIVSQRDSEIDASISVLLEQINRARQFEQVAWQEFKAIAQELSDIKARERYYNVEAQYRNIKSIQDYITNDFSAYFNKLIQSAKKQVARVQTEINGLQERGVDLKEQAEKLLADDQPAKTEIEIEEQEEPVEEPGIFIRTWNMMRDGFSHLWDVLFGWLYRSE